MGVCVGEDRHVLIAFMINLAHNIEGRPCSIFGGKVTYYQLCTIVYCSFMCLVMCRYIIHLLFRNIFSVLQTNVSCI